MTAYHRDRVQDFKNMAIRADQYQDGDGNVLAVTEVTGTPTNNAIARFDGTDGTIQNSVVIIADTTGDVSGVGDLDIGGDFTGATSVEVNALGTYKIASVSLAAAQLGGSETNTSFTFPASGAIFLGAWLNVTTQEAGTIDVGTQGTSNDPDGILDGVSVAATGYVGAVTTPALTGKFMTGSDPVSVTASGDLNTAEATLYISYLELPSLA